MRYARKYLNEWSITHRGVVTRAELASGGVSDAQRVALLREGSLVAIGRHTYRHGGVELGDLGRLYAASVDVGGVVSHRSAAWLHGLPGFTPGVRPEVLVPAPKSSYTSSLARVHTTTWLPPDDVTEVDGIRCTTVARSLFGLAALVPELPADVVRGAVDDAIRLRLASDRWLWWRLEQLRCRGRNGVRAFEAILSARAGGAVTESWLEREFLRVLVDADVPVPTCQAHIGAKGAFVARVDFAYDGTPVIIEVTGASGHSTPAQRAADARRRNRLGRAGHCVLEFTYEQVVAEPELVVADVLGALGERRAAA